MARNSITADFRLTRLNGTLVDNSDLSGALNYIEGLGMVLPGIEKALKSFKEGDCFAVVLNPEDMYGLREEGRELVVQARDVQGNLADLLVGMVVEADTPQGPRLMTVLSRGEDTITLDGNHPLAGQTLCLEGTLLRVRPALEEEVQALSRGCVCREKSCCHGKKCPCRGGR